MKSLTSHIQSVTVFPSIAAITRVATVALPKGDAVVYFDRLPETLTEKSIQVKGFGKATLGNIKIEKAFYDDESDATRKEVMDLAQRAEEKVRIALDKLTRLTKEKSFTDNIIQKVTSPNQKTKESELDPEKWIKMISFYQEKLETLDRNLLAADQEKVKYQDEFDRLKTRLEQLGNPQTKKQKYRVAITLDVLDAGDVTLELSYHIAGARWYPIYDLRVSSDKKINLAYQAMVSQSSGENWDQVELKISTAKPNVPGNLPELPPWHIEIETSDYEAPAPRMASMSAGGVGAAAPLKKMEDMKKKEVTVEVGATSVTFVTSGKQSIKSDGSEEKVVILSSDFSIALQYASVPMRQPYAYLTAKIKNETEVPFLAGEAHVFLDGNFVAVSKIKPVAPTEEFSVSLGIDENLRVEYKLVKEFEKEGGNLFSKKSIVKSFEYQFKITNFKKTTEEITVWDQLPVSQSEQLKVNLIEPAYKGDTAGFKKEEGENLKWIVNLKPGEERVIPFVFTVEVPVELRGKVVGIDI